MKTLILLISITVSACVNAQIKKLWETNHTVGNDSLEVLFYKQDSAGNHYTGGAIGLTFFVSKFNSTGVHQWTVSDDKLIDKKFPSYETKSIVKSWVSDIAFWDNKLYISGAKRHQGQGGSCNLILALNSDGDSIAITNVIDPTSTLSITSDGSGQKPLLRFIDDQLYLFTSLHNWTSAPGSENINVFKYDEDLNLLKNRAFDGIGKDTVRHVGFIDNKFIIHSMMVYWPRLLACDTALNLIWDKYYTPPATSNHSTIPFIIKDSLVYMYHTTRDTSRKQPVFDYKFMGNVRVYDLQGNLKDSLVFFQSSTSDDIITDACMDDKGSNYVAGWSYDSGIRRSFLLKLNSKLEIVNTTFLKENPISKIEVEYNNCRLYVSFIDTAGIVKLARYDENLTLLSEEHYHTGKAKIFSLTAKDKQLHLLSTGKNILTDTLSLKNLLDTVVIAEPIVFTTLPINPRSIELNWLLSVGLNDSVSIYKSTDNENWQFFKSLPSSLLTFTDSNLNPSTRYYYSIIVRWQKENSCDQLFTSDSTPFNTGIIPVKNQSFQIYPNPAYSEIHVQGTEGIEEIELLTLTGEVIRTYYQKEKIAVSDLIPGFYFIRINRTYTYKIIKL